MPSQLALFLTTAFVAFLFSLLEVRSSLPDELLMDGHKLSMAHSLEVWVAKAH